MMPKLLVGWRTKLAPGYLELTPVATAPANYKDPDKISAYMASVQQAWLEGAKDMPYAGTFDEVMLVDVANARPGRWSSAGREPGGPKLPICLAVRAWIMKQCPDGLPPGETSLPIIGFGPRDFLKMLGIECAMHGQPLPLAWWYNNSAAIDIEALAMPREHNKSLRWSVLLKRWGVGVENWDGPGRSPHDDVSVTAELAAHLGLIAAS